MTDAIAMLFEYGAVMLRTTLQLLVSQVTKKKLSRHFSQKKKRKRNECTGSQERKGLSFVIAPGKKATLGRHHFEDEFWEPKGQT